MKNTIKFLSRCAAALSAAVLQLNALSLTASADDRKCPSGLSYDKIGSKIEKFTDSIYNDNELVGSDSFPSFGVAVFCGDEIIYTGHFGETDIENNVQADENTVYDWGSISKTMIWVSVMQLWEQGRLDLDEDIRTYLPDDFFHNLCCDDHITMMNLMNHDAGWCESTYDMGADSEDDIPALEDALRAIEPEQVHRPGEVTAYSNWGAALAALIVERVSGMDYSDYLHENILQPLGMEHTSVSASLRDNQWVWEQRQKLKSYTFKSFPDFSYRSVDGDMRYITIYPAGSAVGTVSDLARYAQALVDDDAPLFRNKETQEKMFSGSAFYGGTDIPSSSYGFAVTEQKVRTFGHDGATAYGISNMMFDLGSKLGFVIMTNNTDREYVYTSLPSWLFGELDPDKYASVSEDCGFKGHYTMSRPYHSGLLSFYQCMNDTDMDTIAGARRIGDGLYQISSGETAMIFGEKTLDNGDTGYSLGSADLIRDRQYGLKIVLLALFFILAAASVYLLMIKLKMYRAKMLKPYTGAAVISAGQAAKIVSVLAMIAVIAYASQPLSYGLPKGIGVTAGVTQLVCMGICALAAIVSLYGLIAKKPSKAGKLRYILNIAGNCAAIFVIVYFEMYRFWGC